jgi:hypothetical protein
LWNVEALHFMFRSHRALHLIIAAGIPVLSSRPAPAATNGWTLLGWNDLGMHCMDGSDYSIFSVLPPYNTFQAHLIFNGKRITNDSGITVTYEAVADPDGSINRTSAGKLNFWQYAGVLYGASPAPDMGLAGFAMPGPANTPQAMHFAGGMWSAEGVPITPYDDATNKNYYPLLRLTARSNGAVLATTDIVVPVSDEMDCRTCHRSGAGEAARPAAGWSWQCAPERDVKMNILRLHDEYNGGTALYSNALDWAGYAPGLYHSALSNATPVLCAKCHKSNALGTSGFAGVPHLTHAMHGRHADVIDPATGLSMDSAVNRASCYRCHPGSETRCLRGAMGGSIASDGSMAINCQQCHGNMSLVAVTNREGWFQEPTCQNCHAGTATNSTGVIRFLSAFTSSNTLRQATDQTFATSSNAPAPGLSLYRFSKGHGNLTCEACHGSTHAEFPSIHRNDNIQSTQVQGYAGTVAECTACHVTSPSTVTGGPHGMHPVGQVWIEGHKSPGESETQCRRCHGTDYRGTVLSRTFGDRVLNAGDFGTKRMWKGFQVGCYNCHNGPNSESTTPNTPAVVSSVLTGGLAGVALPITLPATDANGDALTFRVVSQTSYGTVALTNHAATYYPEPRFVGLDRFTFAAWDGWTDSNLATVRVVMVQSTCQLTLQAAAPVSAAVGTPVPFWSLVSVGGCSNAHAVTWSFGDASGGTLPNDCHSYTQAGIYAWSAVAQAGATFVTNSGTITIEASTDDADADGISDAWEIGQFGSLTNADAASDADLDGFIDLHEYLAGTSPTNDASYLQITAETAATDGGIVVRWASEPNRVYILSRTADLMSPDYIGLASNIAATPTINVYTDSPAPAGNAIYRVMLQP